MALAVLLISVSFFSSPDFPISPFPSTFSKCLPDQHRRRRCDLSDVSHCQSPLRFLGSAAAPSSFAGLQFAHGLPTADRIRFSIGLGSPSLLSGTLTACTAANNFASCVGGIAALVAYGEQLKASGASDFVEIVPDLDVTTPFVFMHPSGASINMDVHRRANISCFSAFPSFFSQKVDFDRFFAFDAAPISTNIDIPPSSPWRPFVRPYKIFTLSDGVTVGLVRCAQMYQTWVFNTTEALSATIHILRLKGVDVVVVISGDFNYKFESIIPALSVDNLPDVYIDHTGTANADDFERFVVPGTNHTIFKSFFYSAHKGHFVDLDISTATRRLVNASYTRPVMTGHAPPIEIRRDDAHYRSLQTFLIQQASIAAQTDPILTTILEPMTKSRLDQRYPCFTGECAQGNVYTGAYWWRYGVDFALTNAGGPRGPGIAVGNVRMSDVWGLIPFENYPCTGTILGLKIWEMMTVSLSVTTVGNDTYHTLGSRIILPYGLRIEYDNSTYAVAAGTRIRAISIFDRETKAYKPLERLRLYTFATDNYQCDSIDVYSAMLRTLYEGESVNSNVNYELIQTSIQYFLEAHNPYDPIFLNYLVHKPATSSSDAFLQWKQTAQSCLTTERWYAPLATCQPCQSGFVHDPNDRTVCIVLTAPPVAHRDRTAAVLAIALPISLTALVVICGAIAAVAIYQSYTNVRNTRNAPKGSTATIVFTDVQMSTRLWGTVPASMGTALDQHHALIREAIVACGGYEVKTVGDSFMIAIDGPEKAAALAIRIQTSFQQAQWPRSIDLVYAAVEGEQRRQEGGGGRGVAPLALASGGASPNTGEEVAAAVAADGSVNIGGDGGEHSGGAVGLGDGPHLLSFAKVDGEDVVEGGMMEYSAIQEDAQAEAAASMRHRSNGGNGGGGGVASDGGVVGEEEGDEAAAVEDDETIIHLDDIDDEPNDLIAETHPLALRGAGPRPHHHRRQLSTTSFGTVSAAAMGRGSGQPSVTGANKNTVEADRLSVQVPPSTRTPPPPPTRRPFNGIRVRIGIHHGPVEAIFDDVAKGYDYYGNTVNVAARIESVGAGGQIVVSREVANALPPRDDVYRVESLGTRLLRGLPTPIEILQLTPLALPHRTFVKAASGGSGGDDVDHQNNIKAAHLHQSGVNMVAANLAAEDAEEGRSSASSNPRSDPSSMNMSVAENAIYHAINMSLRPLPSTKRVGHVKDLAKAWRIDHAYAAAMATGSVRGGGGGGGKETSSGGGGLQTASTFEERAQRAVLTIISQRLSAALHRSGRGLPSGSGGVGGAVAHSAISSVVASPMPPRAANQQQQHPHPFGGTTQNINFVAAASGYNPTTRDTTPTNYARSTNNSPQQQQHQQQMIMMMGHQQHLSVNPPAPGMNFSATQMPEHKNPLLASSAHNNSTTKGPGASVKGTHMNNSNTNKNNNNSSTSHGQGFNVFGGGGGGGVNSNNTSSSVGRVGGGVGGGVPFHHDAAGGYHSHQQQSEPLAPTMGQSARWRGGGAAEPSAPSPRPSPFGDRGGGGGTAAREQRVTEVSFRRDSAFGGSPVPQEQSPSAGLGGVVGVVGVDMGLNEIM